MLPVFWVTSGVVMFSPFGGHTSIMFLAFEVTQGVMFSLLGSHEGLHFQALTVRRDYVFRLFSTMLRDRNNSLLRAGSLR